MLCKVGPIHNSIVGCGTTNAPGADEDTPSSEKYVCKACSYKAMNKLLPPPGFPGGLPQRAAHTAVEAARKKATATHTADVPMLKSLSDHQVWSDLDAVPPAWAAEQGVKGIGVNVGCLKELALAGRKSTIGELLECGYRVSGQLWSLVEGNEVSVGCLKELVLAGRKSTISDLLEYGMCVGGQLSALDIARGEAAMIEQLIRVISAKALANVRECTPLSESLAGLVVGYVQGLSGIQERASPGARAMEMAMAMVLPPPPLA